MLTVLGLNHEEQHQELLATDIKYILGHNPLFPTYNEFTYTVEVSSTADEFVVIKEGPHGIGYHDNGFCFDNELGHHIVLPMNSVYNIQKANKWKKTFKNL